MSTKSGTADKTCIILKRSFGPKSKIVPFMSFGRAILATVSLIRLLPVPAIDLIFSKQLVESDLIYAVVEINNEVRTDG